MRTGPDGSSSTDVFAELQPTRCHSGVDPHREKDGRGRKEGRNDKVFQSQQSPAALSGCSVCMSVRVAMKTDRMLCWRFRLDVQTGSARMYLQGINFCSIRSFFYSPIWQHNRQPLFQSRCERKTRTGEKKTKKKATSQFMSPCCARSIIPVKNGQLKFAFRLPR